jgi:cyclohexyl-isocyanide hydratase
MTLHIGMLVFPGVQQLDLTGPYELFASAPQTRVDLVWKDTGPLVSSTGLTLLPTLGFADCPSLDVLCVPGGGGINPLLEDAETLDFIRRQAATARFVTSVCTGSLVLGAAGLLRGRRATTHWASHGLLAAFGATPVHERVVRDGTLITAGGVTAGIDFGLAVVAELLGRPQAEALQLQLEYAPAPPFDAGTPATAPAELVEAVMDRLRPVLDLRRALVAAAAAALR